MINFYYNNSKKGYIYGGSYGLELYGNPETYIGGSSMTIASNILSLQSNSTRFRSGSLYVSSGGGSYYPGIDGTYQVLSIDTRYVVVGLSKVYYNMTFYNGILVNAPSGTQEDK